MRRSWTDEDLRAAVACSKSHKATLEQLGLSPRGNNHYEIKARIRALGLDVSHFRQSSGATYPWTEEQLRVAVIDAASLVQILERLGVEINVRYLAKVARHARTIGLRITGRRWRTRQWSDAQLREAVATSRSVRSTIGKLGLVPAGGNYDQVQRRIRELALDTAHFTGTGWRRGLKFPNEPRVPLEEVLVAGRWTSSQKLKQRLIRLGLKPAACELCGWAERSPDGRLPIELDHINGDHDDNRIENLRILCPNCHSLQPTHRGSNHRSRRLR
jgi:hypothetical protein